MATGEIYAKEKATTESFAYAYVEDADGKFVKVAFDRMKEILGIGNAEEETADAVQYIEQELTDEQKTQARTNIGAASADEVSKLQAMIANGNIGTAVEPAEDDIPKVFIDGVIPTTKDDVLAEMRYISKTENFHAYKQIND